MFSEGRLIMPDLSDRFSTWNITFRQTPSQPRQSALKAGSGFLYYGKPQERSDVHELSLAEEMVRIIREAIGGSGDLHAVTVVMGPLSGVCPESLSFCFTEVARQKGMGSPGLVIRRTDAVFRCSSCGFSWTAGDFAPGCPGCGSWEREILSGREFYIESAELNGENEDEDEHPGDGQEQGTCRGEPPDL